MGGLIDFGLTDESVGASEHVVALSGEIDAHSAAYAIGSWRRSRRALSPAPNASNNS